MSHAPRHLIIRTGWLFGPWGRSFITDAVEKLAGGDVVTEPDDQRSQPTSQVDFVAALVALLRQNKTGVWHIAAAGEATPYETVRVACELMGVDVTNVQPVRRKAGGSTALRPRYSVLDIAKLQSTGVRMRPWLDGLRDYIRGRKR